jgi:hypothetical protein
MWASWRPQVPWPPPDGTARQVADGVAFPNGMAVTADNQTLIPADSYASLEGQEPGTVADAQDTLDRLIEEGGDGPGGDRVGDQGADEAGSGGPHDGLRLVDADGDPDDVRYASELVR